jgi:ribosome production factor 2
MFEHKILDMMELHIDADTFRTIGQFKTPKVPLGLKPLLAFSGTAFDSPVSNAYTLAKSLLVDLFRGQDASSVDVEALQYQIHFAVAEPTDDLPNPPIHMRVYKLATKRSGTKLPRVELEEMGPRIDFRIGRVREADESMMREALKKPKQLEAKTKKNVETDLLGDKIGRIHVGRQDLDGLQTRKMKGLKRHLDVENEEDNEMEDVKMARLN